MSTPTKVPSIFDLMMEDEQTTSEEEERQKRRRELIEPTGVKELFKEGKISINKFTCEGTQCKLCIKVCPTNALYWGTGEIGIIEELCVYCGACVTICMVDDCIKIERTRKDGTVEKFSKLSDVVKLQEKKNTEKRWERVKTNAITLRHAYKEEDKTTQTRKRQRLLDYKI